MRKFKHFIIGIFVGAILTVGGTAFAEDVVETMIGKTIKGEFPVFVDGVELEKKAIVVEGTSYLPVRKFAEAIGYRVAFDPEGEVLLSKEENYTNLTKINDPEWKPIVDPAILEELERTQPIRNIESEILKIENQLRFNKLYIVDQKGEKRDQVQAEIDALEQQLAELKSQKAQLEAELNQPQEQPTE